MIGERLELLSVVFNVSLPELGELMGLGGRALRDAGYGKRRLRAEECSAFCARFGVPVQWLIDGDETPLVFSSALLALIEFRDAKNAPERRGE